MILVPLLLLAAAQVDGEPRTAFEVEGAPRVGGLVTYVVEVESKGGVTLAEAPAFGYALEVDEARVESTRTAGGRRDRFEWTLRVLGGGALTGPEITLIVDGAPEGETYPVSGAALEVPPALAEGEDAPRPLPPFPKPADRAIGSPGAALLVALALLFLPALIWFVLRAKRRGAAVPEATRALSPEERLAALAPDADPAGVIGALPPLVRAIVDARRGADEGAATDEEWAEGVSSDASLAPDTRADIAALVRESSAVRYGGGDPTVFAAREAKARAEELVGRVRGGAA